MIQSDTSTPAGLPITLMLILILFIYFVCFAAGLHSMVTGMDTIGFLNQLPDFCIFKRVTGYKCPGCGMTHAFLLLGRFQITDAFQYNIISPFLFYGGLVWLATLRFIKFKLRNSLLLLLSSLVIFYWIARNTNLIS